MVSILSTCITKVSKESRAVDYSKRVTRNLLMTRRPKKNLGQNLNVSYNFVTAETGLPDGRRYGWLAMAQKTNPSFSLAKIMPSSR